MNDIRNFDEDLKDSNESKEVWNKYLPIFFPSYEKHVWKDDLMSQKEFHGDLLIRQKNGRTFFVDNKNRNYRVYKKPYFMEIKHFYYKKSDFPVSFSTNKEFWDIKNKYGIKSFDTREGWIYDSTADLILHATFSEDKKMIMECVIYSLLPFKSKKNFSFNEYSNSWLLTTYSDKYQNTLFKLIPIEKIKKYADNLFYYYWNGKLNNFLK